MPQPFRPPGSSPLPNREKVKFGTGVAYANPSPTEAVITFTARDADGADAG